MDKRKILYPILAMSMSIAQVSSTYMNVFAIEQDTNPTVEVVEDDEIKQEEDSKKETIIEEKKVEETKKVEKKTSLRKASVSVTASYDKAIGEVTNPKWDGGVKTDVPVSSDLKAKLNNANLSAGVDDDAKTIKVDVQLKNVYLASDYLNGKSQAGESYYNMVNFFTDVKQIQQLLESREDYKVVDSKGVTVDKAYVDELHGLINQIIQFDTSTNLKYNRDSIFNTAAFKANDKIGGTDVIATSKEGNVSFKFHIDSHGWWGYELGAMDSMNGLPMGFSKAECKPSFAGGKQKEIATKYANFFVLDMGYTGKDKCYMLNATDLENPMIYVSADGTKAFLIDVDMYGQNVLNKVIKDVIGDKCTELNIFLTHNHPDHINNLSVIASDSKLKDMTKVYWPENDYNSKYGEDLFGKDKVVKLKDGDKIKFSNTEFQFVEIPNEHTVGGGQLADLTNKVLYVGDTLGAQVHLGGTNISMSNIDNWIAGTEKTEKYVADNGIQYFIGGHTPNLGNTAFATWVKTACEYAKEKTLEDHTFATGRTVIVVENGKVISSERQTEMAKNGVSDRDELNIASITFSNNCTFGDYDKAIDEVKLPKYDESGKKELISVSKYLQEKLDTTDLAVVKNDRNKTITVNFALKDVRLDSDYLNGASAPGRSFYNMMNFFTDVKQIKNLLADNEDFSVIDINGNTLDASYIKELHDLIAQIIDFDPTTNLKYDYDAVYDSAAFEANKNLGGTDVIATSKEGNVTFKFHIDSHGWWGYDLGAHDSITGLVMGLSPEEANEKQHEYTMKYGNFFVIEMENKGLGKLYMLNGTDLENPMIYVSEDGKEAFMIDVDFYGAHVLNKVIKSVIGDKCESLKIFATHNHGDHVNNLAVIAQDKDLKDMTTIIWPENEPHTVLSEKDGTVKELVGKDLVEIFDKVVTVKDMEKFEAAGNTFQFVEILDEHTPGGGQLADLNNKILYCGDTLGAQIHLGGTTVMLSNLDNWIVGVSKSVKYINDNGLEYIIGGHTPYLNARDYASWVLTALNYAKDQLAADPTWKGGLVIVEDGKIVIGDRMGEIFKNGLTDREELKVASVNFRNDITPEEKPEEKPSDNNKPSDKDDTVVKEETPTVDKETEKKPIKVKTDDMTNIAPYVVVALFSGALLVSLKLRKRESK